MGEGCTSPGMKRLGCVHMRKPRETSVALLFAPCIVKRKLIELRSAERGHVRPTKGRESGREADPGEHKLPTRLNY